MKQIAFCGLGVLAAVVVSEPVLAQELSSNNIMDDVLDRFHGAASTWGPAIEAAASRLFWTLVVISMVWTFGMMALRKADIGEFFAELVRFTIFTGFFWWLLINATHGMNIAGTMVASLQQLGAEAGGLGSSTLGPSSILDMGFELYDRTVQATSELSWQQFATALVMELMALAVLLVLAIISVNLLLLLAASWILLYAGVFFLGFGGSRWTSDMAINYYKAILGIAAQLMAMVLLVAIGRDFLNHYYSQISENMASQELVVMLVVSVILMFLVNKVPPMISGLVSGGSVGAMGIGSFGAGAAMGAAMTAAGMAMAGAKMAGGAMLGGAANAVGGASAIKAAFTRAQSNMSGGDMPSFGSGSNDDAGSDNASTGDTPFSQAAGFAGSDQPAGSSSGGGFGRAASLVAGTAGELAKGAGSKVAGKFQDKVNQTAGGRLATSIRESMEPKGNTGADNPSPSFDSDSLGGGWENQTGGFNALSSEDQDKARQSHAEWQARDPEKHTFDVEDYVSYAQERQREHNEEVASFVNRGKQAT
ncbi:P-type conjugative transfer protein TrbL [Oceanisphaera sp. KMM 10153]|uniref:P-type conjugative transfer protein TrbL n=1 Tax=Oceanisphaera submarina TaxID=3390193 RepID=UPI003975A8CA